MEGFPGGSVLKGTTCQCKRLGFDPWVGKMPWKRKWQPTLVFLPGKSHGKRTLAGYSPWGHRRVGHTQAQAHGTLCGKKSPRPTRLHAQSTQFALTEGTFSVCCGLLPAVPQGGPCLCPEPWGLSQSPPPLMPCR